MIINTLYVKSVIKPEPLFVTFYESSFGWIRVVLVDFCQHDLIPLASVFRRSAYPVQLRKNSGIYFSSNKQDL